MYMKKWAKNLTDNPFRNRIFPRIEAKVLVKLSDVIDIFDKMRKRSLVLEENDAVRICLLVLLQQGFLGHQLSHNVSDDMLKLVEHLSNYMDIGGHPSYTSLCPQISEGENSEGFGLGVDTTVYLVEICTLFVGDQLAPPLETLTPTKGESETDWWKASLEYFEGKHVQSEVVSEQLDIEKDGISEKKKKRGSSQSSLQDPTYDQLMTTITKLEGTVATLTKTVSTL
ncbi:hypothetical protein Tco_1425509 [Tanacetum coccineum]